MSKGLPTVLATRLGTARKRAAEVAASPGYRDFVEVVRAKTPWRFNSQRSKDLHQRETYLRGVDHHLANFVPRLLSCMDQDIHMVFDFGSGSGSSSIALALVFPEVHCQGLDISATDVAIATERAKLYGVQDRCSFAQIDEGQSLPLPDDNFDLCICTSVLEYITDPLMRRTCVREMARIIKPGGMLFMTVPNRIYPIEIHSGKLGWNYFPKLLNARMVGSHAWEIQRLARPYALELQHTPLAQLLRPWTNFALKKRA